MGYKIIFKICISLLLAQVGFLNIIKGKKNQTRLSFGSKHKTITHFSTQEKSTITSISWSSSDYLAIGTSEGAVKIWEIDKKISKVSPLLCQVNHGKSVETVTWSPNGSYLASGSDISGTKEAGIKIWQFDQINEILSPYPITYSFFDSFIQSLAWSSDGKFLAGGFIGADNQLKAWKINNNKITHIECLQAPRVNVIEAVAWKPASYTLATGALSKDNQLQIWEINKKTTALSKKCERGCNHEIVNLSWAPEGDLLATVDYNGMISIWYANSLGTLSEESIYESDFGFAHVSLAWSKNQLLAIGTTSGRFEILRYRKYANKMKKIWNDIFINKSIVALAWDPTGKFLATARADNVVNIWHIASKEKEIALIYSLKI